MAKSSEQGVYRELREHDRDGAGPRASCDGSLIARLRGRFQGQLQEV